MAEGWRMWAISLLTIMLLTLLSAAPIDINDDIKKVDVKADVEADNDAMHSHDENVTRGGKLFGHNQFDLGNINVSGSVAGDDVSIGHQVDIDVQGHTHDHHHHEEDTVIGCKEGLRILFKSIDSNKNGLMDAKELLMVCHQNNIQITESLAVRILTLPDKTVGFNMAKFCELLKDSQSTNSADLIHFLLQLFDKDLERESRQGFLCLFNDAELDLPPGDGQASPVDHAYKWENNLIPYFFTSASDEDKALFESVMDIIGRNTCFKFKEETEDACGMKPCLEIMTDKSKSCSTGCQHGYVGITKDTTYKRVLLKSDSQVGDKADCTLRCQGFALHELMHVLGVGHTVNRRDRDSFIEINEKNSKTLKIEKALIKCENCLLYDDNYDCSSIMHMGTHLNGLEVLKPKDPNTCSLKKHAKLEDGPFGSDLDWKLLNGIGNCPVQFGSRLSLNPSPYGNSDVTLSKNVHLKYFNENNRKLGTSWDQGGQSISFSGHQVNIQDENTFIKDIKTIFISHGYSSMASVPNLCENWVNNYIKSNHDVQVICIDWRNLAFVGHWHAIWRCWGEYNCEAKNSVDVGWWLGRLLHSLVAKTGLNVDKVHLAGHSLGAHVAGMMGRVFTELSGKQVSRVTGLDPAGPLFVQNTYGLHKYEIGRDSGAFVDIIHTNGDLNPHAISLTDPDSSAHFGDLHALGDVDFYPNGGRNQGASGCDISYGVCSHGRAIVYYLHSIIDGPTAFKSYSCASAETCSEGKTTSEMVANHMGEYAAKPAGEAQKQYYLAVTTNYGPT